MTPEQARQFATNLKAVSQRSGVPLETLLAVAWRESGFDPAAVGADREIGLMQILPATVPDIGGTEQDLNDPWKNVIMGAKYMSVLRERYGAKDTLDILGGYNAGPDAIKGKKYAGIKDTDAYINAITKRINLYKTDRTAYASDLVKLYYALEGGNGKAAIQKREIPEQITERPAQEPLTFAQLPGEIPRVIPEERPEPEFVPPPTPAPERPAEGVRPSAASLWARGLEAGAEAQMALGRGLREEVRRMDPVAAFTVIGNTLLNPAYMGRLQAGALLKGFQGWQGASVTDRGWASKLIDKFESQPKETAQKMAEQWKGKRFLPGIGIDDLAALPQNMVYTTTVLGVGLPVGYAIHPLLGMFAGGAVAYNMSSYQYMQEYLEAMNDKSIAERGRPISKKEENQLKRKFASNARKYGLFEAGPEALATAAGVGLAVANLSRFVTAPVAARVAMKVAGMYASEMGTEALTSVLQSGPEVAAGLRAGEPLDWTSATDWLTALREVAPQTFLLTTVMGAAGAGAVETKRMLDTFREEVPESHAQYRNLEAKLERDPASIATERQIYDIVTEQIVAEEPVAPGVMPAGRPAEAMPIAAETPEAIPREKAAPAVEGPAAVPPVETAVPPAAEILEARFPVGTEIEFDVFGARPARRRTATVTGYRMIGGEPHLEVDGGHRVADLVSERLNVTAAVSPVERITEAFEQPALLPRKGDPEVREEARVLAEQANREIDEARALYRDVMDRGGIRPETYEEFVTNVPPHWRRKAGLAADEMAAELNSQEGYAFDTADDMFQDIAAAERMRKRATADLPKGKRKYVPGQFIEDARAVVQGRFESQIADLVDQMDEQTRAAFATAHDGDVVADTLGNVLGRSETVDAMTERYGAEAVVDAVRAEIENRAVLEAQPEAPAAAAPGELFAARRELTELEAEDMAAGEEDPLMIHLLRRGWTRERVREIQESIARKQTPDMFTGETEPLTAGELEYQRNVQDFFDAQTRPELPPAPEPELAPQPPPAKDTAALSALGYTDSQIRRMMPWAAQTIIEQNISPEKVSILPDGEIGYMEVPPGNYDEEQRKTEQEFLDDSPPVGLGVKEIIPLGVSVEMPPIDLVGPARRIWAGGLRTVLGHFKAWIAPVRIIAEMDPVANKIAHMGRDTVARRSAELAQDVAKLNEAYKGLTDEDSTLLEDYLQDPTGGEKVPDRLRAAYEGVNELRWKYYRMAEEDFGIDVSTWGMSPEVYWPHVFVGSYEIGYPVAGPEGRVLFKHIEGGFVRNLREAVRRIDDYWRLEHPELLDLDPATQTAEIAAYLDAHPEANLTIRPRQFDAAYSATLLSRKGFWRFIGEVKDATELDAGEVLSMMRGVAAIKPRGKFVGNLMQRTTNLGGYMHGPRAFEIYMSRMLTKKYYDPFRRQATDLADRLPPALRQYFLEYIDDLTGKYDPFNHRFTWTGIQAKITRAESFLKLGFRPVTALVNRFQPAQLAYGEIGHYLFRGWIWKHTAAGRAVLDESGIYGQVAKYAAGEPGYMVRPTEPIYMPLGLFSRAEMANREDVVAGGYLFARKVFNMTGKIPGSRVTAPAMIRGRLEMLPGTIESATAELLEVRLDSGETVRASPERVVPVRTRTITPERMGYAHVLQYLNQYGDPHRAALEYAKDLNTDVNFDYSAADLPKLFRIKGGRAVLQFRSFPVNFVATTLKWTVQDPRNPHYAARLARLIGANTLLGGVRMVPYIGRKLWWKAMVFAPLAFLLAGDEKRDTAKKVIGRGVFSLLGIDLSQRLGVGEFIPRELWQALGPAAGDFANLVRFVRGDLDWPQLLRINPMLRDVMRAIPQTEHLTDDERARVMTKITGWDRILEAIGAPEIREEVNRDMVAISAELARNYKRDKAKYVDRMIAIARRKDYSQIEDAGRRADRFWDDIAEVYKDAFENGIYISSTDIQTEMVQKGLPQLFRVYRTFPLPKRPEFLKMIQEANSLYGLFPEGEGKPAREPAGSIPEYELQ